MSIFWLNETLEPGCPRNISVETARHWLHELGFKVLSAKKGFVDGHERADVVESRSKFLRRMIGTYSNMGRQRRDTGLVTSLSSK